LIQENNFSPSEQRSKEFTINLVDDGKDPLDLEANFTQINEPPRSESRITQWVMSRIKTILVVIVVGLVVGFIVAYLYKRK